MADDVTGKGQGGRLPSRYYDPFQSFRSGMDRLSDSFLTGLPPLSSFRQSLPAEEGFTPALDVKETEKELVLKASSSPRSRVKRRRRHAFAAAGRPRRGCAAPRGISRPCAARFRCSQP